MKRVGLRSLALLKFLEGLYDFRISVYMLKNIQRFEIFMGLSHSLFSTTGDEKLINSLCINSSEMYIYEYHTLVMQVIHYKGE